MVPLDSPDLQWKVRRLLTKGGSDGKVIKQYVEATEWEYFLAKNPASFALDESREYKENVFCELNNIEENQDLFQETEEMRETNDCTYQLVNVKYLYMWQSINCASLYLLGILTLKNSLQSVATKNTQQGQIKLCH